MKLIKLFLRMNYYINMLKRLICYTTIFIYTTSVNAQEYEPSSADTTSTQSSYIPGKGFHAGLYVGAFWANKNTAYIYDGYGFDLNGQRNTFGNSILYNQIVGVYGGANGGVDYIAQLLNVNHGDWYFNEQDMPTNLKYTTTYLVGLNTRYQINKKASITLNINGSKLIVNGKFTISSMSTNNGFNNGVQGQTKLNQFTITGAEQRLMFQLGYQRVIGNNEKLNFLVEGGVNFILSKAQKNQAFINSSDQNNTQNNIVIDLMSIYNQPPYNAYGVKYLIGGGIGAVGGIGLHLTINPRYTVQLLYNPSYDRVSLGFNPKFKMQHGVGLRIYYNLS